MTLHCNKYPGRSAWRWAKWTIPACLWLLTVHSVIAQTPLFAPGVSQGLVQTLAVSEASGIVASRQNPGVLWTHNDSGFPGIVFALSTNGALLASYRIPNAFAGDYEDIAVGPGPLPGFHYLYLGDIGDNTMARPNISVFRFPEPAVYGHQESNPSANLAEGSQQLVLSYPDGHYNAEALMIDPLTGDLFIATKLLTSSRIYRATREQLDSGEPIVLTFVRQIPFFKVSGGDISPDGRFFVLRRGNTAAIWNRRAGQSIVDALGGGAINAPVVGEPGELNGEAIGFHPSGLGYYTVSEGMAQPLYFFRRVDAGVPRQPVVLVGPGENWRYRDLGSDEGVAWRESAFDDSAWAAGPAQLGYRQGDERTTLLYGPNPFTKFTTTYFRKTFMAGGSGVPRNIALRLCFNDGVAVYLNGVEILRRNLVPGATFSQFASASASELQNCWQTFAIGASLVQPGLNTIAVEVHRQAPSGEDLSFDLQLVEGALDVNPVSAPVDVTIPRVTFTSPAANAVVTNEVLTVRGTASDNAAVTQVDWAVGAGEYQAATGTKSWSAQVPLEVGTNVVSVMAFDARTNASVIATRTFIRLATSPLGLTHTGQGTIAPNLNGATLIVGRPYTVTATPAPRNLFAGWSGGVATNAMKLRFLMESNLVLQANFVTNPFIATKGSYRGLFEETGHPSPSSSGSVTVSVTERGAATGTLRFGTKAVPFSCQFDLEGNAIHPIRFPGTNLLIVSLSLDLTNETDLITGEIIGNSWTATLLAYRSPVFNQSHPSPNAGRYTLFVAGTTNNSSPMGHGVAAISVGANGSTTISGTLADGSKIAQTAPISKDGRWPFYATLYGGQGTVLSWLDFTNDDSRSVTGRVNWIKPTTPDAAFYPGGFTNTTSAYGSGYTANAMTNFLRSQREVCLAITGLAPETQTNCLTLTARNTLGGPGIPALKLDPGTGFWTGNYLAPGTTRLLPVKFIFLLPSGIGGGYVLGTNGSASLTRLPSP